jgi:3-oxoacyl-[acyl-carrier protein] reductase
MTLPPVDFSRLGPAPGFRLIVTGGAGGIGRRLVAEAVRAGAQVAALDLPGVLARHKLPAGVATIPYDARDPAATQRAFAEAVRPWGGAADGFVHLPGYMTRSKNFDELTVEEYDEGMAVNLRSLFLAVREVLPAMRQAGGGAMVFAASGLATLVEKGTAAYSAAKAGIIAAAKGLAKENAPLIRVNCVAPGAVDTEFLRGGTGRGGEAGNQVHMTKDMDMSRMLATIPMGRIAVVDDVIGPILFLLGDKARFMTGQTLYINGGRLMV